MIVARPGCHEGRKDRKMTIYTARHRRDPWASIRYTLAQPLRLRGMIAVGAVTGLLLGLIAWACLIG